MKLPLDPKNKLYVVGVDGGFKISEPLSGLEYYYFLATPTVFVKSLYEDMGGTYDAETAYTWLTELVENFQVVGDIGLLWFKLEQYELDDEDWDEEENE